MICLAGKNQIVVDALDILLAKGISKDRILACTNATDDGVDGWQPSFKARCTRENISIVNLQDLYQIESLVFISLEFDKIIKPARFASRSLYNIHFSLLPAYKGMYTSVLPILAGEAFSGVTLHLIDSGIDTGEIVDQQRFALPANIRAYDLYYSFLKHGIRLFEKNIDSLLTNDIKTTPQPSVGAGYFSKNAISFQKVQIDLNKTAFEIDCQIRAFSFRPYQLPEVFNYKISHTRITSKRSSTKPGNLIAEDNFSFTISSIDYDIILFKDKLFDILDASKKDDLEFIQKCESLGYVLQDKNERGWDCFIVSIYNRSKRVFDYLIEKFDPNTVNINGTTALMYAMTASSFSGDGLDFIEALIARGANLALADNKGVTLMEYARKYDNATVVRFLESKSK